MRFRLIKAENLLIFSNTFNIGSGNFKRACKIYSVL